MNLTIEKNIPIRSIRKSMEADRKSVIDKMELLDSFHVECDIDHYPRVYTSHHNVFVTLRPKKFTSRRTDTGIRFWRVK